MGSFPLYHTSYETYDLIDKFIDPNLNASSLLAKVMSETVRFISSSLFLPFDTISYSDELNKQFNKFKKDYGTKLNNLGISLDDLEECLNNFKLTCVKFEQRLGSIDKSQ